MEGLRILARTTFHEEQKCNHPESLFSIIEISAFPSGSKFHTVCLREESELRSHVAPITSSDEEEQPAASLRLVRIPRRNDGSLHLSKQCFIDIFEDFGIEMHILYLVTRRSYGFHHFGIPNDSTRPAPCSFYVGTLLYALIWSYNPTTMATKAMMLYRNDLDAGNSQEFDTILKVYQDHIYTPTLLAFIAGLHTNRFLDDCLIGNLEEIRDIEGNTGHGSWRLPQLTERFAVDEITDLSRRTGNLVVNLVNSARDQKIAASLLSLVSEIETSSIDYPEKGHISTKALASVAPVVQSQIGQLKLSIEYLQERSKNQMSVLFGLLTHEDAISNMNLASYSAELAAASTKIAEATKKDSSAMKTIAVMTMAFLPATFFAALFSIPSLQWDKPRVIQDKFWIYWAFSMPSTLLVFMIWGLVTNRDLIKRWIRRLPNGDTKDRME